MGGRGQMFYMRKWRDCMLRVGVPTLTSMPFRVYNFATFWWKKLEGWDKANSEATHLRLHPSPTGCPTARHSTNPCAPSAHPLR